MSTTELKQKMAENFLGRFLYSGIGQRQLRVLQSPCAAAISHNETGKAAMSCIFLLLLVGFCFVRGLICLVWSQNGFT